MRLRGSFGASVLFGERSVYPGPDPFFLRYGVVGCCRPQQLHLTAADEMLAVENMDVLKLNGFELEQVEELEAFRDEDEEGSGVRMRLQLVAQPVSKDTVFDIKGNAPPFDISLNPDRNMWQTSRSSSTSCRTARGGQWSAVRKRGPCLRCVPVDGA